MVQKKKGMPSESELVLCTVTKIYPHSVFADIDDYENKQGMIHISEISPGRIRNIHEFVREGKKIICKVLKVNLERGHIDLSLRRVSEGQKREKSELMKKQQIVERIIDHVAVRLKIDGAKLQQELETKAKEYETLHFLFEDFIADENVIKKLGLDPKIYAELADTIRQRIKPPEIQIEGDIKIKTYAPDGVNVLKGILASAKKIDSTAVIRYRGGGHYSVNITTDNYKDAENTLKKINENLEASCKKAACEFDFQRVEKK